MSDTSHLLQGDSLNSTTTGLPDSIVSQVNTILKNNTATNNGNQNFWHFLPSIFIMFIVVYIIVKIGTVLLDFIKLKFEAWFAPQKNSQYEEDYLNQQSVSSKNYLVYNGGNLDLSRDDITNILEKYYTYYRNLDEQLQFKFFDRLNRFMQSKQFIIHSQEPIKEMPVLISAAAVQISFGLDDFELPHYPYIQIHKEEYFAKDSLRILAGNVEGSCITLAWNQLLKGFSNYEDGNNVGLHEMAHALYFQEIVVDRDNSSFELHFNELMYRGETVLQQNQCPHNLYTDYAFTNLQEFWAVSVELFFERANDLYNYYPKVFNTLQHILNQNPKSSNKPV